MTTSPTTHAVGCKTHRPQNMQLARPVCCIRPCQELWRMGDARAMGFMIEWGVWWMGDARVLSPLPWTATRNVDPFLLLLLKSSDRPALTWSSSCRAKVAAMRALAWTVLGPKPPRAIR
jgi:hypothetical protein